MKIPILTRIVVLWIYVGQVYAEEPRGILKRIERREAIVTELAEEVVDLFENRASYVRNCSCSRHLCLNNVTGFECVPRLGNDPEVCGPECKGRRIGFEWSAFKTPPDTPLRNMEPRLKEAICLYSHLEPKMKELITRKSGNFLHFSGTEGHQRIYPVLARYRGLTNGDEELNGCVKYDPRRRPWFLAASTRPKDIVFVMDVSGSMINDGTYPDGRTRWDITKDAMSSMLDTLTSYDYVNIVTFSESAKRLGTVSSLLPGTKNNLDFLKRQIEDETPSGLTNFDSAFREAFDILTAACDDDPPTQSCSHCHKVIFFLTDGRDSSRARGRSISATSMLRRIERYQQSLEDSSGSRAMIFTFSMGEDSDGSIPRQISCANNGSWTFIGSNDDPFTAMASYYHFLTNSESYGDPVWAPPYDHVVWEGNVTSVSKAVFSRGTKRVQGIFLGVVGHTVLLRDLEAPGVPYQDILDVLTNRSRVCGAVRQNKCQLQVNRNAFANKAVCADHISHTRTGYPRGNWTNISPCYRGSTRTFYKLFTRAKTWDDARDTCEEDHGRLATIQSEQELAFVAGVSSPDGSWIGAHWSTRSLRWAWINRRLDHSNLDPTSEYWAIGEPNNSSKRIEYCVEIDRRGSSGNLNNRDCNARLSFICEYSKDEPCATVVTPPRKGYFSMPPLTECVHEEQSLANAQPLTISEDLTQEKVMCPLGRPKHNFSVICCPNCERRN